jgi:hypothetical protein
VLASSITRIWGAPSADASNIHAREDFPFASRVAALAKVRCGKVRALVLASNFRDKTFFLPRSRCLRDALALMAFEIVSVRA